VNSQREDSNPGVELFLKQYCVLFKITAGIFFGRQVNGSDSHIAWGEAADVSGVTDASCVFRWLYSRTARRML